MAERQGLSFGFVHVNYVPCTHYYVSLNVYFLICKTNTIPNKLIVRIGCRHPIAYDAIIILTIIIIILIYKVL